MRKIRRNIKKKISGLKPKLTKAEKFQENLKADFRFFIKVLWPAQGLPKPTPMQLLIADILQKSEDRKLCILGFRGLAKTMLLAAFNTWQLLRDPNKQIAIWGSNQDNAADTTQLMFKWIKEIPWLQHLTPKPDQDQSMRSFDVRGRGIFRGSSVQAFGIGGSVTGTRADFLTVDDPETSSNGDTAKKRIAIDRAMNEATFVIKPEGRIIVLGTVHFDDSLYTRLINQGYRVYIFPMCIPSLETQELCWDYYPRRLQEEIKKGEVGDPLDRFTRSEIELKRQTGLLPFERQCLVNPFRTSLSQKLFDLKKIIIYPAEQDKLPIRFYHNPSDRRYLAEDVMGWSSAAITDRFYIPHKVDDKMKPYDMKVMRIDPAGGGADEIGVAVGGTSSGYVVLFSVFGLKGGATDENLTTILETARRLKVDSINVEDNFGQGMFAQLLRAKQGASYVRFGPDSMIPIVNKRSTQNKERKIAGAIDPVLNFGKLIITPDCLQRDYESANVHHIEDKMVYRLSYQLSYFAEGTDKLEHDDRIEVVAELIKDFQGFLSINPSEQASSWEDLLIQKAFEGDGDQFGEDGPLENSWECFAQEGFLPSRRSFL